MLLRETMSVFVTNYDYHPFNELLDVIFYLQRKVPISYKLGELAPDGNDALNTDGGTINFYFNTNVPEDNEYGFKNMPYNTAMKHVKAIEYWLNDANITIDSIAGPEESNSYENRHVVRFNIVGWPEAPENEAPESGSIENETAKAIMDMLGYGKEDAYTVNAKNILYKIREFLTQKDVDQRVEEPSVTGNIIYGGRSSERILRHVKKIEQIAQWAVDNGYETVTIS